MKNLNIIPSGILRIGAQANTSNQIELNIVISQNPGIYLFYFADENPEIYLFKSPYVKQYK